MQVNGPVLPAGTSLSQEMLLRNYSGNLGSRGAYRGRVDATVPASSIHTLVAFLKIGKLADLPTG